MFIITDSKFKEKTTPVGFIKVLKYKKIGKHNFHLPPQPLTFNHILGLIATNARKFCRQQLKYVIFRKFRINTSIGLIQSHLGLFI